jgi:hypothetical protein
LNGTPRPVERNPGSADIISESDLKKASNGGVPQPAYAERPDDEPKQKPGVTAAAPEFVFLERMAARHGPAVNAETILDLVKAELDGRVTLSEFLEHDAMTTTAPEKLANPSGHYRSLASRVARRHGLAALENTLQAVGNIMAGLAQQEGENSAEGAERCPRCQQPKGRGVLIVNERFKPCPDCSRPEWAEYVRAKGMRTRIVSASPNACKLRGGAFEYSGYPAVASHDRAALHDQRTGRGA